MMLLRKQKVIKLGIYYKVREVIKKYRIQGIAIQLWVEIIDSFKNL